MSATIWRCECGAKYEIPEVAFGRKVRCSHCGVVTRVEKPSSIKVPTSIPKTSVPSRETSSLPLNKTEVDEKHDRERNLPDTLMQIESWDVDAAIRSQVIDIALATPSPSSSPGETPPVPPPVARPIDKGNGGSRSEPSSSQAAAKATPIDAPGPDSSSESNNKPGYEMRYVFAFVACGFELVAYAAICDITGWNRMGFIGLIPLLIFLAIWRATWVAITKTGNNGSEATPTKASSAAHEASTSYEVRSLELSKAVGEQGAEKTSAQTPFSTSGPSATRPLMWHAGRLFARCREVYSRRPGILLIPAGIMTAGILLLIGVMSRSTTKSPSSLPHTPSVSSTDPVRGPTVPPPKLLPGLTQKLVEDLAAALDRGHVALEAASGTGASSGLAVDAYLINQRNTEVSLDVSLGKPLFLRNRGRGQNMFVIKVYLQGGGYLSDGLRSFISLQPKRRTPVQFLAYCADFDKDNPSKTEELVRDALPVSLMPLLQSISNYQSSHPNQDITTATQTAIWLAQGVSIEEVRTKFEVNRDQELLAREFLK